MTAPVKRWVMIVSSLVCIAGASLTLLVANIVDTRLNTERQLRFEGRVSVALANLVERVGDYFDALHGVSAFFDTSDGVSREEFAEYAQSLRRAPRYQGFVTLNYAVHLPAADRPTLEAAVRTDKTLSPEGYPGFTVKQRPGSKKDWIHPVIYMEPMEPQYLGVDIYSLSDANAVAIAYARDSGESSASGKILTRRDEEGVQYRALAMRTPIYRRGLPRNTIEARRAAFIGTVGAAFNIDRMMVSAFKGMDLRTTTIRIIDMTDDEEQVVFENLGTARKAGATADMKVVRVLRTWGIPGGRIWSFTIETPSAALTGFADLWLIFGVFFTGTLITMGLTVVAYRVFADRVITAAHLEKTEHELWALAMYDTVTKLPNRNMLHSHLDVLVKQVQRGWTSLSLIFIDLDHFKSVNDTLGHRYGDDLLRQCGERFKACTRSNDILARIGGDEFVLLLIDTEGHGIGEAEAVAAKILKAARTPFVIADREVVVSASLGISNCPADSKETASLIRYADIAMYRAKKDGGDRCYLYADSMNSGALARMAMVQDARKALELNQFEVYYQPKMDLSTGSAAGAEALIRWNHPEHGLVTPTSFIPLLEETGLIIPVGEWVLSEVCKSLVAWHATGLEVHVAVNVSARQIDSRSSTERLLMIVNDCAVKHLLTIEVTESTAMSEPHLMMGVFRELKKHDVRIALDDFGTGYSSLASLKYLPLDYLKVDQSFVRGVPADREDAAIVRAVINLADSLGLRVIAEGVETTEQVEFLRRYGCHEIQGYHYARPLRRADFDTFLQGHV